MDFNQWRSKIADPTFVDKLEQEHKAVADYWSRFTKYEQTNEWSPAGWTEESTREYSFSKVDPTEKDTRAAKVMFSKFFFLFFQQEVGMN